MNDKTKHNWNIFLDFIPKALTPGLLITIIFMAGSKEKDIDNRFENIKETTFSSPLQKFQIINHVEQSRSELENYKIQRKTDSILKILQIELVEKSEVKGLAQRNAVQIYQIKEAQENSKRTQKEILEKLEQIINNQ